jgi:hypothetical protein
MKWQGKDFIWSGKVIKWKEDWEEALLSLTSQQDADAFKQAATNVFGEDWANIVGYMSGEVEDRDTQAKIQQMLGVVHPITVPGRAPDINDAVAWIAVNGEPEWLLYAVFTPRRKAVGIIVDNEMIVQIPINPPAPETL